MEIRKQQQNKHMSELSDAQAEQLLAETNATAKEILYDKQVVEATVSGIKLRTGSGERVGDITVQVSYTTDGEIEDTYGTSYPPGQEFTVFHLIKEPSAKSGDKKTLDRIARELKDVKRLGDACEKPLGEKSIQWAWLKSLEGSRIRLKLNVRNYTNQAGEAKTIQQYIPDVLG